MSVPAVRSLRTNPTALAAILGGTLALVLLIDQGAVGESGAFDSLDVVFAGSLLAGFLARRYGGNSLSAGVGSVCIALLDMFLSVLIPIRYFIETYGLLGYGMGAAIAVLFGIFIFAISALIGSLGGGIGGWVGKRFPAQSAT